MEVKAQKDIHWKLKVFAYTAKIGNIRKTCLVINSGMSQRVEVFKLIRTPEKKLYLPHVLGCK